MPAKSGIANANPASALVAAATPAARGVLIVAAPTNTGVVYVGFSNAVTAGTADATDGMPLPAGAALEIPGETLKKNAGNKKDDASQIFLIGSLAGQKVFYLVL